MLESNIWYPMHGCLTTGGLFYHQYAVLNIYLEENSGVPLSCITYKNKCLFNQILNVKETNIISCQEKMEENIGVPYEPGHLLKQDKNRLEFPGGSVG